MKTQPDKLNGPVEKRNPPKSEGDSAGGSAKFEDQRPQAAIQRKLRSGMGEASDNGTTTQLKTAMRNSQAGGSSVFPAKTNHTGLPAQLKSGVEGLSGMSMDDVKVHYNSNEPAQFKAHAFAQGSDIHVAPGQEKHLPHEAWHVVQQKQGRVKPTRQLKSQVSINDDAGLEKEADVMGAKAANGIGALNSAPENPAQAVPNSKDIAQLKVYDDFNAKKKKKRLTANKRVKTLPALVDIVSSNRDIGELWVLPMVNEVWNVFGSNRKPHIGTQEVLETMNAKEKKGIDAFNYFKGGEYLRGELRMQNELVNDGLHLNRIRVKKNFKAEYKKDQSPWLEDMVAEMQGNVLGMMDSLIVSFYYNREADVNIEKSGALTSSHQRNKGLAEDEKTKGNTPKEDEDLRNDDYVFGFMEHGGLAPKYDTRFAAPATEEGKKKFEIKDAKEGMRIYRPLRWYLNQPGVLIQMGDLLGQRARDKRKGLHSQAFPDFIVGIVEREEGPELKKYKETPMAKGEDKATRMIKDMFHFVKMKIWSQIRNDTNDFAIEVFQKRVQHVFDDYHKNVRPKVSDEPLYFDTVIRKYAQAQVLFPQEISHEEGNREKDALQDYYDYDNLTEGKPASKDLGPLKRKLSNISDAADVEPWPKITDYPLEAAATPEAEPEPVIE